MNIKSLFSLFVFVFIINESVSSQDSIVVYYNRDYKGKRPKLGLVLSGGGAKGIAHVGVLRVMERAGLKPDYITGTSMGSIVGGLYAIGYSADSLERLIEEQDWTEVLSNKLSYRNVNMEEKWDYGEYIAEFPFIGWKPSLPQGAIKGQELELLFDKLTVSVAGDTNFDNFYIPYRAVAVDILTGNPYVFKSGNLALAMRSSMSIPTIMDPVKYRGMLLVDGGLVNNFPVDVCKEMGADIIIGVYTGGELMPEDKLTSLFNILKQSSLLAGIKNAEKQRKNVDLYIKPYLSDLSASDFNSASIYTDRGYQAASRKFSDFKRMAFYFEQFTDDGKKRPHLTDSVFVIGRKFNIIGENSLNQRLVENVFKGKSDQEWLSPDDIKSQIDLIYGTRLFKKITYDFSPSPNIDSGVILNYNIQKEEDRFLTFAFQYKSESKFGLNIGFKYRNLFISGSKLDLKFRLSEYPALRARYFTYLGYKTKNGLALNYYLSTSVLNLYEGISKTGEYKTLFNNYGLSYHRYISRNAEYFVGLNSERNMYRKIIDIDNLQYSKIKSVDNNLRLGFSRNMFDKKYFTQKGSKLDINVKYLWNNYDLYYIEPQYLYDNPSMNENSYDSSGTILRISLNYTKFSQLFSQLVLENHFDFLASFNSDYASLNAPLVGGINVDPSYQYAFWGLPENYDMFYNGWIYRIGLRYNFYDNLFFSAKANLMFVAQDITKVFDTSLDPTALNSFIGYYDNYLFGIGLQLSYESMIGPVSVTVSKGSDYSIFWWSVRIGYNF